MAFCAVLFSATSVAASTVLPLEVNYPVGSVALARLHTVAPTAHLRISIHGLEFEGEAELQIGRSAPISLRNDTVKVLGPGETRHFPIGSSDLSYYDLEIPAAAPAGEVAVKFRLARTSARLSGFRIVKLDLQDSTGKSVLVPGQITEDDPATWASPPAHAGEADLAEGRRLFTQEPLLDSPLNPHKQKMRCSDCHADDGGDLKYFNYSNASIISRSMFHGLNESQGEQVAAYIRSLKDYVSQWARPWNPPYQPGPGLDQRSQNDWAAGAGIDAVLDHQRLMLPYIFPRGIFPQALLEPSNLKGDPSRLIFSTLNMREFPIDLPLPDWNHWLPFISLRDGMGGDVAYEKAQLRRTFATMKDAAAHGDLETYRQIVAGPAWEFAGASRPGPTLDPAWVARQVPQTVAQAKYSVNLWKNVRTWQVQQRFGLDDRIGEMVRESGPFQERHLAHLRIERRAWPTSIVFTTSPKFIDRDMGPNIVTGNPRGEQYLRDAWYWQQLILNPGQGMGCGNNPVDWGYLAPAVSRTGAPDVTGEVQFLRLVALEIKSMQERDNGVAYGDAAECGWNPYRNPSIFNALLHDWDQYQKPGFPLDEAAYSQILIAIFQGWLSKNRSFDYADWHEAARIDPTLRADVRDNDHPQPAAPYFLPQMRLTMMTMTCLDALQPTQRQIIVWLGGPQGRGAGLWPDIDWFKVANSHPQWKNCRGKTIGPTTTQSSSLSAE